MECWNKIFTKYVFYKNKKNDKSRPDVLSNFQHTLREFKLLRSYLRELGFNSFVTREFNQDPLENFFCQIRQHGGRNNNPTCTNFSTYYRTLLINSCTQYTTSGSNCENTNMENLIHFLTVSPYNEVDEVDDTNNIYIPQNVMQESLNNITENFKNIVENILSAVRFCDICCALLINNQEAVIEYIRKVIAITNYFMIKYCYITKLTKHITENIKKYVISINSDICCEHQHIEEYVIKNI